MVGSLRRQVVRERRQRERARFTELGLTLSLLHFIGKENDVHFVQLHNCL